MSAATQSAFYANLDRANALMDELQTLASRAVTSGVMTDAAFRAYDPYEASAEVERLDNARIDAGDVSAALLAESAALVTQLEVEGVRLRGGAVAGTSDRNRQIILATLGAGLTAIVLVGLLTYFTRESSSSSRGVKGLGCNCKAIPATGDPRGHVTASALSGVRRARRKK